MSQYIYKNNKKLSSIFLFFIIISLSIIAGLRPLKYFMDTEMYIFMINTYDDIFKVDPAFWIITQLNKYLFDGNVQMFFLIYAFLGVGIKIFAINNFSSNPIFSIFCYILLYFVLYDMTAIRAGVSIGIFLLALPDIINKNWKLYFLKVCLAVSFHYSALIMVFLYFINTKKLNLTFYFSLPLILFLLSFQKDLFLNGINFVSSILPTVLEWKIRTYIILLEDDGYNKINRFNPFIISLIFIYYISLINIHKFKGNNAILLIKLLCLQISCHYLLYSVPVMAGRISQFIGISLIIFIPLFINIFKEKFISYLLIIVWLIIYFIFTIVKYTLIF